MIEARKTSFGEALLGLSSALLMGLFMRDCIEPARVTTPTCRESAELVNGSTIDKRECPPGARLEVTSATAGLSLFRCVCPPSSAAAVDAGDGDGAP